MRDEQRTTTSEDSATQLLICEALSLAIFLLFSAISDLVSVTEDVWSVATKHVNVLLPVQIPNFAAGGASIKLKKTIQIMI